MFILKLIPITKSIAIPSLSYFSARDVELGSLVTVPLRKQEIKALVVGKEPLRNLKSELKSANFQLRNIISIHKERIFNTSFLAMAQDLSKYQASYLGLILDSLSPKALLKNLSDYQKSTFPKDDSPSSFERRLLQRSEEDRLLYYKIRARECLLNSQSLHIICPSIQHSQKVFQTVSKGIETQCILLNSELSTKKLKAQLAIMDTQTSIIMVSTPLFLSVSPDNSCELIIESCSSAHYRTISHPQIDMKVAIERYAYYQKIACVYADSLLESKLFAQEHSKEALMIEPFKQKVIDPKKISLLSFDIGTSKQSQEERIQELQHKQGGFHPLHHYLNSKIQKAQDEGKKIFFYVNKKGLAPNIICNDCGNLVISTSSGRPYTLYQQKNKETGKQESVYICHHSGEKVPAFDQCQFCKGIKLKKLGIGTQSLAQLLEKEYPHSKILLIDGNSVSSKKKAQLLKEQYQQEGPCIVVGTQKTLSIIDTWDIAIVVSLAPLFSQYAYAIEEQVAYLITQLYERSTEHLYLQDRKGGLQDIKTFIEQGLYEPLVLAQLARYQEFNYPPYSTLIKISIRILKKDIKDSYRYYYQLFKPYDPMVKVQAQSKTQVHMIIIIKLPEDRWNMDYQDPELQKLLYLPTRNLQLSINPQQLS